MFKKKFNLKEINKVRLYYSSALEQLKMELNIINDEFSTLDDFSPINHIQTRIKSVHSIADKMQKRNIKCNIENTFLLTDIVGARIVCNFIDDVYDVVNKIKSRNKLVIIDEKDYIKYPKTSGYRGYHIIVNIPVMVKEMTKMVKCEIQIRTMAMDFWASSEHKLNYKSKCISHTDQNAFISIADKAWEMDLLMNKLAQKKKVQNPLKINEETKINFLENLVDMRLSNEISS